MDRSKRIFFLLLINLILAFLSLYILDFLQILDYRQIVEKIPLLKTAYRVKVEDPYLLEKVELEKKWEIYDDKMKNYLVNIENLSNDLREVEKRQYALVKEKKNIMDKIADHAAKLKAEEDYDVQVRKIATEIMGQAPKNAVEKLNQLDNLKVKDIFDMMVTIAQEAGDEGDPLQGVQKYMSPEKWAAIARLRMNAPDRSDTPPEEETTPETE